MSLDLPVVIGVDSGMISRGFLPAQIEVGKLACHLIADARNGIENPHSCFACRRKKLCLSPNMPSLIG